MYYCSNCGASLPGPAARCPGCGVSLRQGGQGSENDRRTIARRHRDLLGASERREARLRSEMSSWKRQSAHHHGQLETLQQYCGLMHALTGDYHLARIGERLAWLTMDPQTRRGYVRPSWEPGSYADKHRADPDSPGRKTLRTIAEELWTWRSEHWDTLVKAVLDPPEQRVVDLAQRGVYLSTARSQENLEYLGAVLQLERRTRRQLTVSGRLAAVVTSVWTWRLLLSVAGLVACCWLAAERGVPGWWAWPLAAAVGVVVGLVVVAVGARQLRWVRRAALRHHRVRAG